MRAELYHLPLGKQILVFLDISTTGDVEKRLYHLRDALKRLGATESTGRTFIFGPKSGVDLTQIYAAMVELEPGDCVTVVHEQDGIARAALMVPAKVRSGLIVTEQCAVKAQERNAEMPWGVQAPHEPLGQPC